MQCESLAWKPSTALSRTPKGNFAVQTKFPADRYRYNRFLFDATQAVHPWQRQRNLLESLSFHRLPVEVQQKRFNRCVEGHRPVLERLTRARQKKVAFVAFPVADHSGLNI